VTSPQLRCKQPTAICRLSAVEPAAPGHQDLAMPPTRGAVCLQSLVAPSHPLHSPPDPVCAANTGHGLQPLAYLTRSWALRLQSACRRLVPQQRRAVCNLRAYSCPLTRLPDGLQCTDHLTVRSALQAEFRRRVYRVRMKITSFYVAL
jgi:hypothetical protein